MMESIDQFLRSNPVGLVFLVMGLGYLIGRTSIRGFELGSVSGVLFVGLIFGHFGYIAKGPEDTYGYIQVGHAW